MCNILSRNILCINTKETLNTYNTYNTYKTIKRTLGFFFLKGEKAQRHASCAFLIMPLICY